MRDDEGGAASHADFERGLNRRFVFGVERACRFVENQDARIFEQHARDREALTLAAGKFVSALADDCVVAFGKAWMKSSILAL